MPKKSKEANLEAAKEAAKDGAEVAKKAALEGAEAGKSEGKKKIGYLVRALVQSRAHVR
jgi:hypothetical protein